MQVINVSVNRDTFIKLKNGERLLDVRIDVPEHKKGDILIYTMLDEDGARVQGANLAFLITTKVMMDEFVERIGEQMLGRSTNDPDDLVVITLTPVGRQGVD